MIICKSARELARMEKAGNLAALAREKTAELMVPGVKTKEIDRLVEEFIRQRGGIPAFKGYRGFPASVCVSINEEVVHGIPGERILKDGDIVSIDVGAIVDGYYGDCARTFAVGNITKEAQQLMNFTQAGLKAGIDAALCGARLSDISHAIQNLVEGKGFSVVREYVGHGIGRSMHEPPQIPNYGPPGRGPVLRHGMTLAIEPMVNIGSYKVKITDDGWTVVTADGSLSAHFEDTIVVLPDGPKILTVP